MINYIRPLVIFVLGNLLLLIVALFMPGIDTATAALASETAELNAWAWGWNWLMSQGVVRLLIYLIFEGLILFATAKAFLAQKEN